MVSSAQSVLKRVLGCILGRCNTTSFIISVPLLNVLLANKMTMDKDHKVQMRQGKHNNRVTAS
jgi:hypothetical protein